MSGLKSRNKGKRGERELVKYLKSLGFSDARRTQQYCGDGASDVICPSLPGAYIECKYGYDRSVIDVGTKGLEDAMAQAQMGAVLMGLDERDVMVFWRPSRCKSWRMSCRSRANTSTWTIAGDEDIRRVLEHFKDSKLE